MKTNITLASEDRTLFGVTIRQQTKTGFLNLSDLQDSYDSERFKKGWHKKRVDHLLNYEKSKTNAERIFYILQKQELINVPFRTFIETIEKQGLTKTLKQLKVYKTTGARSTRTTWANPYIWLMVALEMHPEIYAETVIWLADELIINRIEAGNFYKELSASLATLEGFPSDGYIRVAKGLNYAIFGRHETGIRNLASEKELKELQQLESRFAFAINQGYIKSFDHFISELGRLYKQKRMS